MAKVSGIPLDTMEDLVMLRIIENTLTREYGSDSVIVRKIRNRIQEVEEHG